MVSGAQVTGRRGDPWPAGRPLGSTVVVVVASLPLLVLLLLPLLRDGLEHPVQSAWESSGRFWQLQYDKVLDACGHDSFTVFVHGTAVLGYLMYWVPGGLYTLMDLTCRPLSLRKYKVQPGTNEPVKNWPLVKCLLLVNFNQLVLGLPFLWGCYRLMVVRGADFSSSLPPFSRVLLHITITLFFEEILFYYFHRLCHHHLLYKHIHKIHHEWQSPISITAAYAHPLEHFFVNMIPIMFGPLLLGSHPATVWLWLSLATLTTLAHHSGYHLPLLPSPQYHDFHHLKFTGCYGVLGVLDYLHGTDLQFRSAARRKIIDPHLQRLSTFSYKG